MWYGRLSIDEKSYLKKLKHLQNLAVEIGMEKGFTVDMPEVLELNLQDSHHFP